ncbi:MAG TPA: hypothetical protein VE175_09195 [Woeseiaceae bacterium]|jgi:hypothetical protein|nr:hypothetical protein [Woeseiaceae bacterium]
MDGIVAVVFLVRCGASLLSCETMPTDSLRYPDMASCRSEASRLLAARRQSEGSKVWMAKCRYLLVQPDPRRVRQAQAAPGQPAAAQIPRAPR